MKTLATVKQSLKVREKVSVLLFYFCFLCETQPGPQYAMGKIAQSQCGVTSGPLSFEINAQSTSSHSF